MDAILHNSLDMLITHEDLRYTVGDLYYFRRFYDQLSDLEKNVVRTLVAKKRLDMVHGAFVSSDEATTNYADMLRNHEMGRSFLWNEFGLEASISWQLDPFGHSSAYASILGQLGFDIVFFSR